MFFVKRLFSLCPLLRGSFIGGSTVYNCIYIYIYTSLFIINHSSCQELWAYLVVNLITLLPFQLLHFMTTCMHFVNSITTRVWVYWLIIMSDLWSAWCKSVHVYGFYNDLFLWCVSLLLKTESDILLLNYRLRRLWKTSSLIIPQY